MAKFEKSVMKFFDMVILVMSWLHFSAQNCVPSKSRIKSHVSCRGMPSTLFNWSLRALSNCCLRFLIWKSYFQKSLDSTSPIYWDTFTDTYAFTFHHFLPNCGSYRKISVAIELYTYIYLHSTCHMAWMQSFIIGQNGLTFVTWPWSRPMLNGPLPEPDAHEHSWWILRLPDRLMTRDAQNKAP